MAVRVPELGAVVLGADPFGGEVVLVVGCPGGPVVVDVPELPVVPVPPVPPVPVVPRRPGAVPRVSGAGEVWKASTPANPAAVVAITIGARFIGPSPRARLALGAPA